MNPSLESALARFDPLAAPVAPSWERILVVRNSGISLAPGGAGELVRGFDLVILSSQGKPVRYCKIRGTDYHGLKHENETLELLRRSSLRDVVSDASGGEQWPWNVQVARFLEGPLLTDWLQERRGEEVARILTELLALAHRLSTGAQQLSERWRERPLSLARESQGPIEYLRQVTDLARRLEILQSVLDETEQVRSLPQHGDLWSGNVIMDRGSWRIIDLEYFGDTMVPLYDVFHLLRTQHECDGSKLWIEQIADDGQVGARDRRIIAESSVRCGLDARQIVGCLLYYVLHQAATTHRDPLRAPEVKAVAMRQLERVCEIGEGATLSRMLGLHA